MSNTHLLITIQRLLTDVTQTPELLPAFAKQIIAAVEAMEGLDYHQDILKMRNLVERIEFEASLADGSLKRRNPDDYWNLTHNPDAVTECQLRIQEWINTTARQFNICLNSKDVEWNGTSDHH